jgi:hypothetical protein
MALNPAGSHRRAANAVSGVLNLPENFLLPPSKTPCIDFQLNLGGIAKRLDAKD